MAADILFRRRPRSHCTSMFSARSDHKGRTAMFFQSLIGATALALVWWMSPALAQVFDFGKYPDLKGQWVRIGAPRWDTSKPPLAQEPPLTAEYQAIFEAGLKDQAEGGQGTNPTAGCLAPGMPRSMNVYHPMEIVIAP